MRRLLPLLLVVASFSCGNPAQPNANPIRVTGQAYNDGTQFVADINLSRGGSPLNGAVVRINGTLLAEYAPIPGRYHVQSPIIPSGTQMTLEITSGRDKVSGVTTIPRVPVLVAPVAGDAVHLGTPVAFSWTASASPDEFWLILGYWIGDRNNGDGQRSIVPGSVRSGSVATTPIPATATHLIGFIQAESFPTFTGPADPASRVEVYVWTDAVSLVLGT